MDQKKQKKESKTSHVNIISVDSVQKAEAYLDIYEELQEEFDKLWNHTNKNTKNND
jgi:hypothetical protein